MTFQILCAVALTRSLSDVKGSMGESKHAWKKMSLLSSKTLFRCIIIVFSSLNWTGTFVWSVCWVKVYLKVEAILLTLHFSSVPLSLSSWPSLGVMVGERCGPSSALSLFRFFCMLILLMVRHLTQVLHLWPSGSIALHLDWEQYLSDGEAESFFGWGSIWVVRGNLNYQEHCVLSFSVY